VVLPFILLPYVDCWRPTWAEHTIAGGQVPPSCCTHQQGPHGTQPKPSWHTAKALMAHSQSMHGCRSCCTTQLTGSSKALHLHCLQCKCTTESHMLHHICAEQTQAPCLRGTAGIAPGLGDEVRIHHDHVDLVDGWVCIAGLRMLEQC